MERRKKNQYQNHDQHLTHQNIYTKTKRMPNKTLILVWMKQNNAFYVARWQPINIKN